MAFSEQLAAGIDLVRKEIERHGSLRISETFKFKDRRAHYFLVSSGAKQVDFVLAEEFLSDLPGTKEYQNFLEEYGQLLSTAHVFPSEQRNKSVGSYMIFSILSQALNLISRWFMVLSAPFHPNRVMCRNLLDFHK